MPFKPRVDAAFRKLDTSGDSALDVDELQAGLRAARRKHPMRTARLVMSTLDANRDGRLSQAEFRDVDDALPEVANEILRRLVLRKGSISYNFIARNCANFVEWLFGRDVLTCRLLGRFSPAVPWRCRCADSSTCRSLSDKDSAVVLRQYAEYALAAKTDGTLSGLLSMLEGRQRCLVYVVAMLSVSRRTGMTDYTHTHAAVLVHAIVRNRWWSVGAFPTRVGVRALASRESMAVHCPDPYFGIDRIRHRRADWEKSSRVLGVINMERELREAVARRLRDAPDASEGATRR